MKFLDDLWAKIRAKIGRVIARVLEYIWDWVDMKVREKIHEWQGKSEDFKKAYALRKFHQKIVAEYAALREKLSPSDLKELDELSIDD